MMEEWEGVVATLPWIRKFAMGMMCPLHGAMPDERCAPDLKCCWMRVEYAELVIHADLVGVDEVGD